MIAIVLGTRPELIKTAPVLHELRSRKYPVEIVHTGQHYTPGLDRLFFEDLNLPKPAINLQVGSQSPTAQLASIIAGVGEWLAKNQPRAVLVQGDTNSVLGGALAAFKLGIPVAHLEAGLRSDDWSMPEEGNRVLTGRIASLHFCPTEQQAVRLAAEGISRGVHVVGNTVVDATLMFGVNAKKSGSCLARLGVREKEYILLTLHRPGNVDDPSRLRLLLEAVRNVAEVRQCKVLFPVHPRTQSNIEKFGLLYLLRKPIVRLDPVGYLEMLELQANSELILTDSGGVQEEACTLGVPCITLRANTERPETVIVGANTLWEGQENGELGEIVDASLDRPRNWSNPFGDGHASRRVVDFLLDPNTTLKPSAAQ